MEDDETISTFFISVGHVQFETTRTSATSREGSNTVSSGLDLVVRILPLLDNFEVL